LKMWQIAARRYAATNGTLNAGYLGLPHKKRIRRPCQLSLNKPSDESLRHFTQQNRAYDAHICLH